MENRQFLKMFTLGFLSISILTISCNQGNGSSSSKKGLLKSKADCVEPQNPYNDGGGHDAGFNWARENSGECDGNSESFNEGCQEYHRQLNLYNDCIKNSR
jgi:hypothetical protein